MTYLHALISHHTLPKLVLTGRVAHHVPRKEPLPRVLGDQPAPVPAAAASKTDGDCKDFFPLLSRGSPLVQKLSRRLFSFPSWFQDNLNYLK